MRKFLSMVGLSAALATLAVAADPQFDAATIRLFAGGPGGTIPGVRNGRFTTTNASLRTLIGFAYQMPEALINGPAAISQAFDVTATMPAGATPDQAPGMLRALLEERFHLKSHRESAEMSYYALEIAKGGFKLKPLVAGEPIPAPNFGPGPPAIDYTNGTIADFAQHVARMLGRPVVEQTGLTGRFQIMVRYAKPNSTEPGPDLLTAVQEQLGLKLESKKGPVEILKVDSVDKAPTGN